MDFVYQKSREISLEKAISEEWLETNGLGGYSSSTIINCHTRKYHGLLVSQLDGLSNKYVLFSKLEDVLIQGDQKNFLTAHSYPNFFQDGCFKNLKEFFFDTHPGWCFDFGNVFLTKEILLLHEENTVLIKYKISSSNNKKLKAVLSLNPLLACRDFHALQRENSALQNNPKELEDGFSCNSYAGLPTLFFQVDCKHEFFTQNLWYRNFIYKIEKDRGYDFQEDLFSQGTIEISNLKNDNEIIFSCSLVEQRGNLAKKWQTEIERRVNNLKSMGNCSELQRELHRASKSFVKNNKTKKTYEIVAGYHWFLEWGRDAMISLPGLTLYSNQEDICLEVLKSFASHESQGLIPNFLGKTPKENAYNSVDASLWFVWAVQQYYLKTKNLKELKDFFWPTLKNIFYHYKNGTLYNIKMQDNNLLYAGDQNTNVTWMDAVVNGKPATSRYGYQVEVNALWFNLLGFMNELADLLNEPIGKELKTLIPKVKDSFNELFWCEEKRYLYDYINASQKNSALRPNQVFAVSLPYSMLSVEKATSIMESIKNSLLTPYGLRTLAPNDSGYCGDYHGDQAARDVAYHNGTVWPWLIGAFVEGLLRVNTDNKQVLAVITPCLKALQEHLVEYGIGGIAEIFSGNAPHQPNGCISQAWSVAEVLRSTYLLNFKK